jgi:hypothetical protein
MSNPHRFALRNVHYLLDKKYPQAKKYPRHDLAHIPHFFNRTLAAEIYKQWKTPLQRMAGNKFRSSNDLHFAHLFAYYVREQMDLCSRHMPVMPSCKPRADYCFGVQPTHKSIASEMGALRDRAGRGDMPKFINVNDKSPKASAALKARKVYNRFLLGLYPEPSPFEKYDCMRHYVLPSGHKLKDIEDGNDTDDDDSDDEDESLPVPAEPAIPSSPVISSTTTATPVATATGGAAAASTTTTPTTSTRPSSSSSPSEDRDEADGDAEIDDEEDEDKSNSGSPAPAATPSQTPADGPVVESPAATSNDDTDSGSDSASNDDSSNDSTSSDSNDDDTDSNDSKNDILPPTSNVPPVSTPIPVPGPPPTRRL